METVGSREKFWISGEDHTNWLVKFPRLGTGEHWAEKVAAEVGTLIGVNTAQVELARVQSQLVTICRSFRPDEDALDVADSSIFICLDGCDFLEIAIAGYDSNLKRPNRAHNIKNIVASVLSNAGVGSLNPLPRWDEMIEDLASYAILDGLIGNTDRHHENWMVILREEEDGNVEMYLAPSYDHASSLGRELDDSKRERLLASNAVLAYLQSTKARGGVFLDDSRLRAPTPLYLAKLVCRSLRSWSPSLAGEWLDRLDAVHDGEFRSIIDKIPCEFISETAREFAYEVMVTSRTELLRSIR